ncbi:hypothetical protein Fmac_011640 [Flemingia macrophylla]|uniref:F-box domain-containing protein n=1 Tax=Flemingia macrophylla TaxID=520843 RepID=A0ABD1MN13_9FABA
MKIGWVVRNKRSKRVAKPKPDMFKILPNELQVEIMKCLDVKHLSIAMCVSKPWRNLVLGSCLPPILSLATRYLDQINEVNDNGCPFSLKYQLSRLVDNMNPFPFMEIFTWCSQVMGFPFYVSTHFIGSFSGLLLFWHNEVRVGNQLYGPVHYYVINPITKQCVDVFYPQPQSTPFDSYVAVAYDPLESWFFRIVQFKHCCSHANVFSSETGCWTSLSLQLPQIVCHAAWEKKLIYSKGAIYWLSSSGHVIKLLLDAQENVEKQAVAIELPEDDFVYYHKDILLIKGKVVFVSVGENLRIWKFMEYFDDIDGSTFGWILIKCVDIRLPLMKKVNREGEFLGIHPYYEVIFYKIYNEVCYYFYNYNSMGVKGIEQHPMLYLCLAIPGFPFLECSAPFCCGLDMEVISGATDLRIGRSWCPWKDKKEIYNFSVGRKAQFRCDSPNTPEREGSSRVDDDLKGINLDYLYQQNASTFR